MAVAVAGRAWYPFEDERPDGELPEGWSLFKPALFMDSMGLIPDVDLLLMGISAQSEAVAVDVARQLTATGDRFFSCADPQDRTLAADRFRRDLREKVDIFFFCADPGWEAHTKSSDFLVTLESHLESLAATEIERVLLGDSRLWRI